MQFDVKNIMLLSQLLSSSDILDLKYRNGTATLSINEVYPEDVGLYTCKAKNTLGLAASRSLESAEKESRSSRREGPHAAHAC